MGRAASAVRADCAVGQFGRSRPVLASAVRLDSSTRRSRWPTARIGGPSKRQASAVENASASSRRLVQRRATARPTRWRGAARRRGRVATAPASSTGPGAGCAAREVVAALEGVTRRRDPVSPAAGSATSDSLVAPRSGRRHRSRGQAVRRTGRRCCPGTPGQPSEASRILVRGPLCARAGDAARPPRRCAVREGCGRHRFPSSGAPSCATACALETRARRPGPAGRPDAGGWRASGRLR